MNEDEINQTNGDHAATSHQNSIWIVLGCGLISLAIYSIILWLSGQFSLGQGHRQRPILEVLGLFGFATTVYLVAQFFILKVESRKALQVVIVGSVLFRAVMLFSQPIQEVDIYRYIWDGAVVEAGVNPFRYSPHQVLEADSGEILNPELSRLVRKRDESPGLHAVLKHVHFNELSTPYPTTSQAAFALSAILTPPTASEWMHILIMKTLIVGFDLGVLWVLILMLRETGRHYGWALAYGWCPLIMKEFANSGHLDSITVFLSLSAIYVFIRGVKTWNDGREKIGYQKSQIAAVLLALAVGGKFYPVVFAPLIATMAWKTFGTWRTVQLGSLFVGLSFLICVPMFTPYFGSHANNVAIVTQNDSEPPPVATSPSGTDVPDPGIAAFLGRWEINDLLFMLVAENVKPNQKPVPWFVVVPNPVREEIAKTFGDRPEFPRYKIPFLVARVKTLLIWAGILVWLMIRVAKESDVQSFLGSCFLSVAWFWLLCPTQNPWYWNWALPLIPFVRHRSWYLMSGMLFLYYFRFWLTYHFKNDFVFGTKYYGDHFYYFVIPWFEFGPVLLLLLLESFGKNKRRLSRRTTEDS